jgi:hypothetical protein
MFKTFAIFLVDFSLKFGIIPTAIEMADLAENRTFSYQQIHAKISSKSKEITNNEQRTTTYDIRYTSDET